MDGLQRYERHDVPGAKGPVVSLHLAQEGRPVVVLDRALLESIDRTLDAIAGEFGDGLGGFVLASEAPKAYIAGANLREIMDLDDPGLHDYLRFGSAVYRRISSMRCATVAAIDAACLGGGLEIAMHCDALVGADPGAGRPYPVGLPEAGLSICPGWGGTVMLPARMSHQHAIHITAEGRPMTAVEAQAEGLFHTVVPALDLLPRAIALAAELPGRGDDVPIHVGSTRTEDVRAALASVRDHLPKTGSAAAVVECVEAGLDRGWEAALECERDHLVRLRNTEEGRGAIEAFFAKSASR